MKKAGPKPNDPSEPPKENYFDDVVANAIDFFSLSIKQIQKQPKYSVVNFCAGLELALKARLLLEHWSLIMTKPENADLTKFLSGDFQSVGMEATIQRLIGVCGEDFSAEETKCYKGLRDHRNRLVHFYHNAYTKKKTDPKLLEQIAAEQCNAWRFLHQRLDGRWSYHFKRHAGAIKKLDKELHGLRVFLRTKFESLREIIEKDTDGGAEYQKCSACGYKSARIEEEHDPVYASECRVCGKLDRSLRLVCPKCEQRVSDIVDITTAFCSNEDCEADLGLKHVLSEYAPSYDPKDQEEPVFYCAACENVEPSATILGDSNFCFSCMQWFDRADKCRYCGLHLVGFDPSESAWLGCFLCEDAAAERYAKD